MSPSRAGCTAIALAALALVMMTPPQLVRSSALTGSTREQRRDQHLVPARAQRRGGALAVLLRAGDDDAHYAEKSGAGILPQGAPGVGADGDRVLARAGDARLLRGAAVRLHDQAAELQHAARNLGMAGDRRRQEPSSTARKARSQASAVEVSA